MNLTVAIVTKDRDYARLNNTMQTIKDAEIIIVDEGDTQSCPPGKYGRTTYIHHPLDLFNMPVAFNIAIQECHTPFIMFTGTDMLFSPNFFESLTDVLVSCPNPFIMAYLGYLPRPLYFQCILANDPAIWDRLVGQIEETPCKPKSTGTQAGLTSWFESIRGFDERFVGLGGPDSDMMGQAKKHNLTETWIPWHIAQVLHQWHPASELKGMSSSLIYEQVEERNPDGWGR